MSRGARLRQARELRARTQKSLAEAIGSSQATIALSEMGTIVPKHELLEKAADELCLPLSFFDSSPVSMPEGSLGLFRSKKTKVDAPDVASARQRAALVFELASALSQGVKRPAQRITRMKGLGPAEAASYVRNATGLAPDSPIDNLTALLERSGILVIGTSAIHTEIMGFSAWIGQDEQPIIVANRNQGPFRLRFTLAHELGHLVLGHEAFHGPYKELEDEANAFAQEFMMPTCAIVDDFSVGCTLPSLAALKSRWRMSMHAIAMRAKSLNLISDTQYRYLRSQLNERGWLRAEPGDNTVRIETGRLLRQLAELRGYGKPPDPTFLALDHSLPVDVVADALATDDPDERFSRMLGLSGARPSEQEA